MGGSSKDSKTSIEVIDYCMSIQWGVCAERVDSINKIYLNDREVPLDQFPITDNAVISIDLMELFGGPKKAGGIQGDMHVLFGESDQVMSAYLATKHERTPTTMTGHRGFLSLFFTGFVETPSAADETNPLSPWFGEAVSTGYTDFQPGFIWGTNNPMIPAPEVEVTRQPKTLVGYEGGIELNEGAPDANPAAIIHECMTNTVWGSGYPGTAINLDTFLTVAATLQAEEFGLSFEWVPDGPVEEFVNEVLRHINGRVNFDLETSKWELYLLRDDYDQSAIPVINRSNAKLKEYQRKTWADIAANLVVTFTNPDNEENESVTLYDAAAMAVQSVEVRDNSDRYLGIRNLDLAWKVVERDLRQKSALLATATVEIPYAMEGVIPGKPILFDWTTAPLNGEPGLQLEDQIVMRVMAIRPTTRGSAKMTVTLMEDIFSYGAAPRPAVDVVEPGTGSEAPQDVSIYRIGGAPFYHVAQTLGDTAARAIEYPQTYHLVLADAGGADVRDIDLRRKITNTDGSLTFNSVAIIDDQISFELAVEIGREAQTVIPGVAQIGGLTAGDMLWIGWGNYEEIVLISDVDYIADEFTIERGMIDTVPKVWPVGTLVLGFDTVSIPIDVSQHSVGETLRYKLLPTTSQGSLKLSNATARLFTAVDRMHLPSRPTNLSLDAVAGFDFNVDVAASTWTVGWSNRNRITETGSLLLWGEANVAWETGQQITLNLLRNGVLHETVTITNPSTVTHVFAVDPGDKDVGDVFTVEFVAQRDGYDAYRVPTITLTME